MAKRLGVGDVAPDFALQSQTGETVDFKAFKGSKDVVLYFYPKDNTPGCTAEAKAFRDSNRLFEEMGAKVIGISSDSVDSHRDFAAKCELPFSLLSDEGGKVRKLYGVPSSFGVVPGRVTYVIDSHGVIRHVFNSQLNAEKHIEEAARALKSIRDKGGQRTIESGSV